MNAANWTIREQLSGQLEIAKNMKRQQKYDQALRAVNKILFQDPNFSEALYLKAQILWEGFKNAEAAKRSLSLLTKSIPKTEKLHCWAKSYLKEIPR